MHNLWTKVWTIDNVVRIRCSALPLVSDPRPSYEVAWNGVGRPA
jgi:hypothetical protein